MSYQTAVILGAGAFGTSIASVLSHNFDKVILKVRSQDVYDSLKSGENTVYLPGQKLSKNIKALALPNATKDIVKEIEKLINS